MWKKEAKRNLLIFIKAGLPFTIAGMIIVFAGIYFLKKFFHDNEYLTGIIFLWLAVFWFIYQPLFRKRIQRVQANLKR